MEKPERMPSAPLGSYFSTPAESARQLDPTGIQHHIDSLTYLTQLATTTPTLKRIAARMNAPEQLDFTSETTGTDQSHVWHHRSKFEERWTRVGKHTYLVDVYDEDAYTPWHEPYYRSAGYWQAQIGNDVFREYVEADAKAAINETVGMHQKIKYDQIKELLNRENKVTTNVQVAIELEKRAVEKEVERRLAILETWEDFDEMDDGTVIKFNKEFEDGKQVYTYAALKIAGGWYLTSGRRGRLSGKDLEKFMLAEGEVPTEVYEIARPNDFLLFDEPPTVTGPAPIE